MRWINRTQSSFSESFFLVFILGYFLFQQSPQWASKYHFAKSTKTVLSKGFLRENCNSWDELTELKAVSQKSSFQFLTEYIYFFTVAIYGPPNITLQIPQEQSLQKASWGESCNNVSWFNRKQSSFSEGFFSVFILGYFLFHHSPLRASKYHFANSTRTVLAKDFWRGKL